MGLNVEIEGPGKDVVTPAANAGVATPPAGHAGKEMPITLLKLKGDGIKMTSSTCSPTSVAIGVQRNTPTPRGERVIVAETDVGGVRGREGFYHYRQYDATDLARKRTFEDVWQLMLLGELPASLDERAAFTERVKPLRTLSDRTKLLLGELAEGIDADNLERREDALELFEVGRFEAERFDVVFQVEVDLHDWPIVAGRSRACNPDYRVLRQGAGVDAAPA